MQTIALLMTVHNRRATTLRCLRQVSEQQFDRDRYALDLYLTDDGCTDGTPEAVREAFPEVHLVAGDGTLFWNRGMHAAWQAAEAGADYDFFLWLNDDTFLFPDTLARLLHCSASHADRALVVGSTSAVGDPSRITYGGWVGNRLATDVGREQRCHTVSGNIVLVPRAVYLRLGKNDPQFRHAVGDTDYGLRAHEAGIEVWVAEGILGECNLHERPTVWMDPSQPLRARWRNFFSPLGNNPFEFFRFRRRHYGLLPACATLCSNFLHFLFPRLWKP